MRFSPQRRAIFRHRNFKKWSEPDVFCTFSLQNVLLATAACNFSTSELQKAVQTWCVLYIFTSKCASRHSGVQFFDIGTSKSGPNLTCFVHFHFKMRFSPQRRAIFYLSSDHMTPHRPLIEPTFRLTRHTNHWKNAAFRDFSKIWRGWIFFLLTLLHLIWFSSAFQLSILSEVYYLNFLRLFYDSTILLLYYSLFYYSLTLLFFGCTSLWPYYAFTLLFFDSTILWLYSSLALLFFGSTILWL